MENIKITILGGSNSVIGAGYTARLVKIFKDNGVPCEIQNLAIGANSVTHGLSIAKRTDLSETNVLLIEYTINDFTIYHNYSPDAWLDSYEGLVLYVKENYPNATIMPVILGRRDKTFFRTQNKMRESILEMGRVHNLPVVDFDRIMHEEQGEKALSDIYNDGAHYKTNTPVGYLASLIVNKIILSTLRPKSIYAPEAKVSSNPLNKTSIIDIREIEQNLHAKRTFKNSKHNIETVVLKEGESLDLDTHKNAVCIEYISAPNSCDMIVENSAGTRMRTHTRHARVEADGKFKFLIKSFVLLKDDWIAEDNNILKITAMRSEAAERENCTLIPGYNLIPNKDSAPQELYLTVVMTD
ncbi:SGNH/GDSL hydrolase family protein [Rhodobacteraceae bacterium]|nr:SGNH/GDSL hydrolase family protein [Paracoccaceae bacterium]